MSRLTTVRIEGIDYPLYFSVLAMERIYDKFGGLAEMNETVLGEENPARQFGMILDVLCAENYAGVELLKSEGKEGNLLDKKKVMVTVNPFDVTNAELWLKALECINKGQEREVETEESLKNVKATQEETL